jgi:PAS domain S-box-containing protein
MIDKTKRLHSTANILVIDDDNDIIFLIDAYLSEKGFNVIGCTEGKEAVETLKRLGDKIDIILLDILMPGYNGYEVLKDLRKEKHLDVVPIIMLTSVEKNEDKLKAYEEGADDFIEKPFDEFEMEIRIRSLLRIKRQQEKINLSNQTLMEKVRENIIYKEIVKNTIDSVVLTDRDFKIILSNPAFSKLIEKDYKEILGEKFETMLYKEESVIGDPIESIIDRINRTGSWEGELISKNEKHNWTASATITPIYHSNNKENIYGYVGILHDLSKIRELEKKILSSNRKLKEANIETVYRLAYACEARDDETGKHVKRIGNFSRVIALEYGLNEELADEIGYSSMMHDVGKIKIPDVILKKPGKPSPEEWEFLKMHTIYGEILLGDKPFFETARQIARSHHERWDGTGYPDGLKGKEIPISARITAIVDVYDALIHERVYKRAWSKQEAFEYMLKDFGKHFDPNLKKTFKKLFKIGIFDDIEKKFDKEHKEVFNTFLKTKSKEEKNNAL